MRPLVAVRGVGGCIESLFGDAALLGESFFAIWVALFAGGWELAACELADACWFAAVIALFEGLEFGEGQAFAGWGFCGWPPGGFGLLARGGELLPADDFG